MSLKIAIVTIFIIGCTQGAPYNPFIPKNTGDTCITSCEDLSDGNYQSCQDCNVFASCVAGRLIDNRPCPDNLVWDDSLKRCEFTSPTCSEDGSRGISLPDLQYLQEKLKLAQKFGKRCTIKCTFRPINCEIECEDDSTAPGVCVSDCSGVPNGDYQSCQGCDVYATCSNGILYDNRPCAPSGLFWDDNAKKCLYTSTTCTSGSTSGGACVSSCAGMSNGDYQSCQGCGVYATCSNEYLYDNRPCPAGLVWDDNLKRCEYTSTTCSENSDSSNNTSEDNNSDNNNNDNNNGDNTQVEEADTGDACISSCEGLPDGDYQSCRGCSVYTSCVAERLIDGRPCSLGLVWDDALKQCVRTSTTCTEPEGSGDE